LRTLRKRFRLALRATTACFGNNRPYLLSASWSRYLLRSTPNRLIPSTSSALPRTPRLSHIGGLPMGRDGSPLGVSRWFMASPGYDPRRSQLNGYRTGERNRSAHNVVPVIREPRVAPRQRSRKGNLGSLRVQIGCMGGSRSYPAWGFHERRAVASRHGAVGLCRTRTRTGRFRGQERLSSVHAEYKEPVRKSVGFRVRQGERVDWRPWVMGSMLPGRKKRAVNWPRIREADRVALALGSAYRS